MMIRRYLFTIAALVSLLLCTAMCVLWAYSLNTKFLWDGTVRKVFVAGGASESSCWLDLTFDFPEHIRFRLIHGDPVLLTGPSLSLYGNPVSYAAGPTHFWKLGPLSGSYGQEGFPVNSAGRVFRLGDANDLIAGPNDRILQNWTVKAPIWSIAAAFAILSIFVLWLRPRFPRRNHCHRCGYNLTGNTSGTCPECGTPVPSKSGATA